MGIFDFLKRTGGRILEGATKIGGNLLGGLNKARDIISKGVQMVSGVPVVGQLVQQGLRTPLPFVGRSLNDIGSQASQVLDTANSMYGRIGRRELDSPD